MGHSSRFLVLLLLTSLLFLSFDYGFGRVALIETQQDFPILTVVKYDMADYSDPQPNTNPKNGYVLSPPSSPTPTHPPSP
ncbi:hypothetical protein AAZX31_09G216700 [Glycine max]|uniref:Uncharacterized protein n=1 Tax=Glycine soja TaxID=3848 RepID=A0A445J589_GLYSO|nr:uncharacterized protein LOC100792277 [Glycine max]XP_028180309.1 uncharacterized protein LOC114367344 [Glycine soja]KAG4388785.1 hypothetical protein GLYMA_09G236902v4 [Glycine max]KAG4992486.1 hypothetical protein JHK87_025943 [Glycine soja]KAG5013871.1 hypothetical protein JHK86_026132 [Glycine max]KAG5134818.1 hypothetical protein JHK82_026006 [Glycine max]KAH1044493.1 hypothetical protein GYH30_025982 [Glycine max]|eukprot:XP_003534445.1 uncharacterized protein LOC100792277 [Glycine max]